MWLVALWNVLNVDVGSALPSHNAPVSAGQNSLTQICATLKVYYNLKCFEVITAHLHLRRAVNVFEL